MDHAGISLEKFNQDFIQTKNLHIIKEIISSVSRCMIDVNNKFIINADIKPSNIMVNNNNVLLTDWSIAKTLVLPSTKISNVIQTIWYRSPERIMKTNTEALNTDVWSLGIVVLEFLTGIYGILSGDNESVVLCKMADLLGEEPFLKYENVINEKTYHKDIKGKISQLPKYFNMFKDHFSNNEFELIKDLLIKMLEIDPDKRATFLDVYNHSFLGNTPIYTISLLNKLDSLPYMKLSLMEINKKNYGYYEKRNDICWVIYDLCIMYFTNVSIEIVSCTLKLVDIIAGKISFDIIPLHRCIIYAFYLTCSLYSFHLPYICEIIKCSGIKYDNQAYINNAVSEYNQICRELKYNITSNTGICYVRLLKGFHESVIKLYINIYLEIQVTFYGLISTDRLIARIAMYVVQSIKNINNLQINSFIGKLTLRETITANKFLNIYRHMDF
jgi:serine/threonine protein kinase